MQYILVNENNEIEGIFDREIYHSSKKIIKLENFKDAEQLISKKIGTMNPKEMKIAIICNWRTPCGISTYTQFLVESLRKEVKEIKIFSEIEKKADTSHDVEENVVRCWTRGESLLDLIKNIKEWNPNFVLIQHEFGIFPKATNFLQLIQGLEEIPHAAVFHSVYSNHYDKTICTSAIKNIICHSEEAKNTLIQTGHDTNYIQVIPHGCIEYPELTELWNIFQTPYAILQFGFGFFYKGVDRAIQAISILKENNPEKYKNIFYCYLCSESANATGTHAQYHKYLNNLINDLNLKDNVVIIRKFHSETIIKNYLRTVKLGIFPYVTDPNNIVYGASGAIRIALACKIPIIGSESHMFDDLNNVIPRPNSAKELALEIDKIFSDDNYKNILLSKTEKYLKENNWEISANRYIKAIQNILEKENFIEIK